MLKDARDRQQNRNLTSFYYLIHLIPICLSAFGEGVLVGDDNYIRMELQDRGRNLGSHRAIKSFLQNSRFIFAADC